MNIHLSTELIFKYQNFSSVRYRVSLGGIFTEQDHENIWPSQVLHIVKIICWELSVESLPRWNKNVIMHVRGRIVQGGYSRIEEIFLWGIEIWEAMVNTDGKEILFFWTWKNNSEGRITGRCHLYGHQCLVPSFMSSECRLLRIPKLTDILFWKSPLAPLCQRG